MVKSILVPFFGTEVERFVVEASASLAARSGATLRILDFSARAKDDVLMDVVYKTKAAVAEKYEIVPVVEAVPLRDSSTASPRDELLAEATRHQDSIVCVSSEGRNRTSAVSYSLATEVLAKNPNPMILVGPECAASTLGGNGPILVALDGTEESESVLPIAHDWAELLEADVLLITVLPAELPMEVIADLPEGDVDETSYLSHVAETSPVQPDHPNYDVFHGKPAKEIVRAAKTSNASMIAMSSHVPRGFERLVHGSVLDAVVHRSPVPILAAMHGETKK